MIAVCGKLDAKSGTIGPAEITSTFGETGSGTTGLQLLRHARVVGHGFGNKYAIVRYEGLEETREVGCVDGSVETRGWHGAPCGNCLQAFLV